MVEKKTGSVQPPVLDLKARDTTQPSSSNTPKPDTPIDTSANTPADNRVSDIPAMETSRPIKSEPKPDRSTAEKKSEKLGMGSSTASSKTDKSGAYASASGSGSQKPDPQPIPTPKAPAPKSTGFIAPTLAGAAIGLAAAYSLALFGLWPTQPTPTQPAFDATALTARIAALETAPSPTQTTSTSPDTSALQSDIAALQEQVLALSTAEPVQIDTSSFASSADIAALRTQIDAIESAPALADGDVSEISNISAFEESLADLQLKTAALETSVSPLAADVVDLQTQTLALSDKLAQIEVKLAAQPQVEAIQADLVNAQSLIAALSKAQTEFAAGTPFAVSLANIEAAAPALTIPPAVKSSAAQGIPTPRTIFADYQALLPEIMVQRPVDTSENWFAGLLNQAQSAVALRPAGDVEGDSADAILARIEASLERSDLTTAQSEIAKLPAPMQKAIVPISASIAAHLSAQNLLTEISAYIQSLQGGAPL